MLTREQDNFCVEPWHA